MARGRPLPKLELSGAERDQLQAWARGSKTSQALALRSRIVLACAAARSNHEVARLFDVAPQTVGKWRARFVDRRLEGLIDEPRPGAPRKLSDAEIARLVATALSGSPFADGDHWSSRALAAQLGVSQSTVSRLLRATGVTAHAADAQRLSIERVRDIVGLYVDGPLRAIALCVHDKRQGGAPEPPERWPSASPLLPPRRTLTYARYGDATLFEALDLAACADAGHAARGAGVRPFLEFLRALDAALPAERVVHVAIDDRGRRERPTAAQWFARKPRFRLHVAPTCAAWLAQVERWFALLDERAACAPHGDRAAASLERAARDYLDRAPRASGPFLWVKLDEALPARSGC